MQRVAFKRNLIIFLLFIFLFSGSNVKVLGDETGSSNAGKAVDVWIKQYGETYLSIKKQYEQKGYKAADNVKIILGTATITGSSKGDIPLKANIGGRDDKVLNWDESYEWFDWIVDVPQNGLYNIEMEYYPLQGNGSSIQRALMVDGKVPFEEANNIAFRRMWKDKEKPKVNGIGDEVWPKQEEDLDWRKDYFQDNEGMYSEPFLFYLTKGKHTLRLLTVDQSIAIGNIIVKSPEIIPEYKELKAQYDKKGYKNATNFVKFQAEENAVLKSDPTIRRESNGDPKTEPRSIKNRKLNIMGDWRWRRGNQSITWKFQVPEDGLYKIDMRAQQRWGDGLPVFRQIEIDGKIPFAEMKEYVFMYENDWRNETLKNSLGEPYLFYLTKGEHELTMTVKLGPVSEIIESITEDTLLLSEVTRKIIMITGNTPDPNYEYELDKNIPGLMDDLKKLSQSMQQNVDKLTKISTKRPAIANNFLQIRDQLNKMIQKPDIISKGLQDLNNAQTSLGTWIVSLKDQPLAIDYFEVNPPGRKSISAKANIFQKIQTTFANFITSFTKDYDSIGNVHSASNSEGPVINVWVSRGKEWAEIMNEMADEDFTPKTGIKVNMNVVPSSQLNAGSVNALMLAITSGKAPDVALGTASQSPVEFAIRDAAVDLSKFDDYSEVVKRFYPSIITPFEYNKGVYALPENMDFTVLFYRKDIINELNIKIPDTWEELYEKVLPILYQNGMNFYYGSGAESFTPLLFQHAGSYYTKDGTKSALDTPEAYQAFKQFCDMFSSYGIPVTANFFNRMRNGETPIGVGTYNQYMMLSTAAPELYGRWDIAKMPGTQKSDGTIDRTIGSIAGQSAIILEQSKYQKESWEFLKWWTSTEVQSRFGKELESLIGVEARWNTANKDAFISLPWNRKHLQVITEQLKWGKEQPVVLGGYFTSRHIANAWTRVVLGSDNVRDSLEQAVIEINREINSKREEYKDQIKIESN